MTDQPYQKTNGLDDSFPAIGPRHDLWDEVALIRDTINHYAPVLIAHLSIQIRRAGVQKKLRD